MVISASGLGGPREVSSAPAAVVGRNPYLLPVGNGIPEAAFRHMVDSLCC